MYIVGRFRFCGIREAILVIIGFRTMVDADNIVCVRSLLVLQPAAKRETDFMVGYSFVIFVNTTLFLLDHLRCLESISDHEDMTVYCAPAITS